MYYWWGREGGFGLGERPEVVEVGEENLGGALRCLRGAGGGGYVKVVLREV